MKKTIIVIILTILIYLICPLKVNAEENGVLININNVVEIENRLYDLIEKNVNYTPSVAIKVFNNQEDVCSVVYGKSNYEDNIVANGETVYEWGSISKLLVWVSAMQLYEQGKLDLDKDIRLYLPNNFLKKLKYDEPITMLDLMNHSAGFMSPYKEMETPNVDKIIELGEALQILEPAQMYKPGEVTCYSNYGAALAGYVVECISGIDFYEYVNKNIFDKLNMKHTSIKPDLSDNEWVYNQRKKTHCYIREEQGLMSLGECRSYIHIYPAGAACGTIDDLATFAKAFLYDSKDCPLFEKENTLDEMLTPSLYFADGKTPRSFHGIMTDNVEIQLYGHGGATLGFSSLLRFDPISKTGFVMMINMSGDRYYSDNITNALYGYLDIDSLRNDNFTSYDFSGDYILTGGMFENGCFSLEKLLADRLKINKSNGLYEGMNRGIVSITQISDNTIVVKLITGKEYLYFFTVDENNEIIKLENYSLDFIKISYIKHNFDWIMVYLLFISLSLMVIASIIQIIRYFKKYKKSYNFYQFIDLLRSISIIFIVICIYLLLSFGSYINLLKVVMCIFIILCSLCIASTTIILSSKKTQNSKVLNIIKNSLCVMIIFSVIYWDLYQFWGF